MTHFFLSLQSVPDIHVYTHTIYGIIHVHIIGVKYTDIHVMMYIPCYTSPFAFTLQL